MKIDIADDNMREKLIKLERKRPVIFGKVIEKYLHAGSNLIKMKSIRIASKEARGRTGHYMQGFMISPIKKDEKGNLFVKVYNTQLYSMIIEAGGHWKRMPPPMVLDAWIQSTLAPQTETELKSIAFAIGVVMTQNRYANRGQRFVNSNAKKKGRVLTMTRAMKASEGGLKRYLDNYINWGISKI